MADLLPGAVPLQAASSRASAPAPPALSDQVVVVLLVDVLPAWRLWGWWRIARGAQSWRRVPGLRFVKVMGSGFEGGFGLRPSASRQAVFLVFETGADADRFVADSPACQRYRQRAADFCVLTLRAWSARGSWGGEVLTPSIHPPASGSPQPMVALTRASIQPRRAVAFWRLAPAAQASLDQAPGCLLAAGLGEAPLLRQATLSLWTSVAAMDAYARSGAHLAAIRAAHQQGHFSESMFVRFVPVAMQGTWKGRSYGPSTSA